MTSLKRITVLALAVLTRVFMTSASQAESTMEKIVKSGKLIAAVQTQGPPVSFVDKNGKRTGLVIEIMEMMGSCPVADPRKPSGVSLWIAYIISIWFWAEKGILPNHIS